MGKGNDSILVNGFHSGHASLLESPGVAVAHRALPGNLDGGAEPPRDAASSPLAGELPGQARFLCPSLENEGILRIKAKSYP